MSFFDVATINCRRENGLNIFICIDDELGMIFNRRRQSRDSKVISDMIDTARSEGADLFALPFSEKLLSAYPEFLISGNAISDAGDDGYVFVEEPPLAPIIRSVKKMVVYRWNRLYPSDKKLDTPPTECGFSLISTTEFAGSSHDVITKEVYERR